MLDIEYISGNFEEFVKNISLRKIDEKLFDELTELPKLNKERKHLEHRMQILQSENNKISSKIPKLKKELNQEEIKQNIEIVGKNKIEIANYINLLNECESKIKYLLSYCPNLPLISSGNVLIPIGDEDSYKEIKKVGTIPQFNFSPKTHEEIGEKKNYLDFKQTAKISGSRFVTLRGKVAKMEQALINLMLETHTKEHGYELISPPYLVRNDAMFNVGQLPKFSEESFIATSGACYGETKNLEFNNGYRLIPTAEVPLTNLVADKIVNKDELPIRLVAVTPCFRSEVGSAGRDVNGIIRLHQFMKVELVSLTAEDEESMLINDLINKDNSNSPDSKNNELHTMRDCATKILEKLSLPYRIICLSTEDTGFSARITYDIEVWMPSQNKYREISSCSYFGNFQTRRMNGRYKNNDGKNKFLHSFNGSALAIGRTIAAIIENYQTVDGDFEIPEVLNKWM